MKARNEIIKVKEHRWGDVVNVARNGEPFVLLTLDHRYVVRAILVTILVSFAVGFSCARFG